MNNQLLFVDGELTLFEYIHPGCLVLVAVYFTPNNGVSSTPPGVCYLVPGTSLRSTLSTLPPLPRYQAPPSLKSNHTAVVVEGRKIDNNNGLNTYTPPPGSKMPTSGEEQPDRCRGGGNRVGKDNPDPAVSCGGGVRRGRGELVSFQSGVEGGG